ncbi:MAG: phosphatidate cytidylyltransferase [Alphaproteobacteria bacterium]|nr:phosphatidate cytidylyltransferase [Alphaproteobacteria bacterium]
MTSPSADGAWRDLGVRAAAALVLIPIVISCVWFGGSIYELLLLILAGLAIWEWCGLVLSDKERQVQVLIFSVGCAVSFASVRLGQPLYAIGALAAAWATSAGFATLRGEITFWRFCGVPYLVLPVLALFYLRAEPLLGLVAIIWLLAVVWATDTFAYFAGRLMGGPKLSPRYSPNKTWSGLAGGMIGAGCAAVLVTYFAGLQGLAMAAVLGAVTAIVSQVGDIFESAAKRHFNVKDSGTLIPGHGGILDRVDGLLFAAIFVAGVGFARHGDLRQVAHFLL